MQKNKKIEIFSDNEELKVIIEDAVKNKKNMLSAEQKLVFIDITGSENRQKVKKLLSDDNVFVVLMGELNILYNFYSDLNNHEIEYLILPTDRYEINLLLEKIKKGLRLKEVADRAIKESLDYYNMLFRQKKSIRLTEVNDLDVKIEEILDFLLLEINADSVELWLYDPDDHNFDLVEHRGIRLAEKNIPKDILTKLRTNSNFIYINKTTYIPLKVKGQPFGFFRIGRKLMESESANITNYIDVFSIGLYNSMKYSLKKREYYLHLQKGVLKKEVFEEFLDNIISQADRYQQPTSFLSFKLENEPLLSEIFGDFYKEKFNKIIRDISQTIRSSDIMGKIDDHTYVVVLTNTDYMGAIYFLRRFKNIIHSRKIFSYREKSGEMEFLFNIATYPFHGRSWKHVINHLKTGMNKDLSPYFRFKIGEMPFWDTVKNLRNNYLSSVIKNDGYKRNLVFYNFSKEQFLNILNTYIKEMTIPGNKGIGYINIPFIDTESTKDLIENYLDIADEKNFPVYFFSGNTKLLTKLGYSKKYFIFSDSKMIKKVPFLLLLSKWGSYMSFAWKEDDMLKGFHCSDVLLIEELIGKLKKQFYLKQ